MKHLSTAALLLAATPILAQQTGVANPPDFVDDAPPAQATKSALPVVTAPVVVVAPRSAISGSSEIPVTSEVPVTTDESPAVTLKRHDLAKFDPDGEIVTDIEQRPNELPSGTIFRVRLKQSIETASTAEGTPFKAELTESVQHMGRVVVPAGSLVEGRITEIRGGKRFRGAALIHLQAQQIVLPDGSRIPLNASVIDSDQYAQTRIDAEGNIVRKDHAKETLAAISLATGGAAAAGGVIGGGVGALVGAGIGAGVSTVWWLKQDLQTQLPADSLIVMALTEPISIEPRVVEPDYSSVPAKTLRQREALPAQQERSQIEHPTVAPEAFVPTN